MARNRIQFVNKIEWRIFLITYYSGGDNNADNMPKIGMPR